MLVNFKIKSDMIPGIRENSICKQKSHTHTDTNVTTFD